MVIKVKHLGTTNTNSSLNSVFFFFLLVTAAVQNSVKENMGINYEVKDVFKPVHKSKKAWRPFLFNPGVANCLSESTNLLYRAHLCAVQPHFWSNRFLVNISDQTASWRTKEHTRVSINKTVCVSSFKDFTGPFSFKLENLEDMAQLQTYVDGDLPKFKSWQRKPLIKTTMSPMAVLKISRDL